MAGSTLRVRVASIALSVVLHLALAVALAGINHTPFVPVSTSVTVTLINSVGESPVPLPPRSKSVVKIARVAPNKTQPPVSAHSEQALSPSPSVPEASVIADDMPASSASITLPRFNAAYLNNPAPIYPPVARRMGEQGRVVLHVRVRADGTPVEVTIDRSSGSPRLDQAAIEAVRHWRFIPARQGEAPVEASVLVPISFTLHS